jgi:hypothetical protein
MPLSAVVATLARSIMWILQFGKKKAEKRLAELSLQLEVTKRQQEETALKVNNIAQVVLLYAGTKKKQSASYGIHFSEDELRDALRQEGLYLYSALETLRKEGRAQRTGTPGYWIIN